MAPFTISLSNNPPIRSAKTKMISEFQDYAINKGFSRSSIKSMCTENICGNTAGILSNGKENFMFQAKPESGFLSKIKNDLIEQIKKLSKSEENEELNAFICGGFELDKNNPNSVRSFDLYNTIADTLDDLGVKFSMICGKKQDNVVDNMYAVNQHISLWGDSFKDLIKDKKTTQENILNKLEDTFQFVEKNDDHFINIG